MPRGIGAGKKMPLVLDPILLAGVAILKQA